ncbi:hypothetical protein GH714_030779 [Hevea brasiliensis]|uniref:F-box associated beta-propeller type 1 domain-containing protein n=1 Tax=Hevea brasiliensis TaxID=3981 RepID=A0A6A6NAZ0_HEVBR|nr:hypothetical protein GH714_030779 [Hevea brasiliensis]
MRFRGAGGLLGTYWACRADGRPKMRFTGQVWRTMGLLGCAGRGEQRPTDEAQNEVHCARVGTRECRARLGEACAGEVQTCAAKARCARASEVQTGARECQARGHARRAGKRGSPAEDKLWPNFDAKQSNTDLWEHEWVKHGICTGWDLFQYYKKSIDRVEQEIPYPKDIIEKCSFIDIVGSCCNGLICLRDVYYVEDLLGLWDDIYDSESNIVLWNPTTTETKILPESNVPRPPHHSISLEIVEFGFDPRTSDCKVLRIFEYSSLDSQWDYLVEIYSLRDDTWRKVDVTLNAWILPSYKYCDGFFNDHRGHTGANGTFHWRTRYHSPEDVIVSFDLCNEVIKTTGLPDPVDSFESIFSLNEYVALPLHVPYHVELWVLLEYGVKESWTKLFTIAYPEVMRPCLPLGFSRNGELFFSDLGGQLLVWNPTTEAIARVQVGGRVPWKSLQTVTYRESHIPLKALFDSLLFITSVEEEYEATEGEVLLDNEDNDGWRVSHWKPKALFDSLLFITSVEEEYEATEGEVLLDNEDNDGWRVSHWKPKGNLLVLGDEG